ncbi:hypothetical protein EKO27_g5310 [Xylaria grammica]|uniref:Uncharacterized protein n=1 Tax=Xylaria grammica TaxID=363999 RepID=A0A439D5Z5_9PEZI|nr:hypothetical protein EKO27_g5310 [Xylaria grammica]
MRNSTPISDLLDHDHYEASTTALRLVLATDIALETRLDRHHPIRLHTAICTKAFEHARPAREHMCIDSFSFETKSFQSSTPRLRRFQLRPLELALVALHRVTVDLFRKGSSDIDAVTSWKPPPSNWPGKAPWPTLFAHPTFTAHEQYPDGVADMVGYWAEDRILGGVALFDRSQAWGDEEPNAYFQSSRPERTYRIYQLTDRQQLDLLRFLYPHLDPSNDTPQGARDNPCPVPCAHIIL